MLQVNLQAIKEKDTILQFFGVLDSVRVFTLKTYDVNQIPIMSGLHNKTLRLSKYYGLLDFFQIKNFPDTLHHYKYYGGITSQDSIGHWCVKEYELHKGNIGDVYQLKTSYSYQNIEDLSYFRILNEGYSLSDYIIDYKIDDSSIISIQIDTNQILSTIPFKYLGDPSVNYPYFSFDLKIDSGCFGFGYYGSYEIKNTYYYCSASDCYSRMDQDCQDRQKFNITPVIGKYEEIYERQSGALPCGGQRYTVITYSNISSNTCGNLNFSAVEELEKLNIVRIFPNPAQDNINISVNDAHKTNSTYHLLISDITGKKVYSKTISQTTNIDVSMLPNGVYILTLGSKAHKMKTEKLIIQR